MTWFTYTKNSASVYAPVRKKILFPTLVENLKQGDWVHVNLDEIEIGRVYYYDSGLIKSKLDYDSYLVVYETTTSYTPTYSRILGFSSEFSYERNLWFKSVTDISAGSELPGSYYIYYHNDNIQFIELSSGSYVSTDPETGPSYIASESGTSASSIDMYSTVIQNNENNDRLASLSFLGTAGVWNKSESSTVGAKAIGTFNGPKFKLYAEKGPDCGKIKLKIVKTSSAGEGQKIVKSDIEIDLYSPTQQNDQNVYSFDVTSEQIFSTYEEIYGDFSFEVEIINAKNPSSSGNKCKIEKYSFSKKYNLALSDEEINSNIAFKSIGGLK